MSPSVLDFPESEAKIGAKMSKSKLSTPQRHLFPDCWKQNRFFAASQTAHIFTIFIINFRLRFWNSTTHFFLSLAFHPMSMKNISIFIEFDIRIGCSVTIHVRLLFLHVACCGLFGWKTRSFDIFALIAFEHSVFCRRKVIKLFYRAWQFSFLGKTNWISIEIRTVSLK